MKRTGYLIELAAEPENLRLAFHKAQRGKQGKEEVMLYRERLDANLAELRQQMLCGNVHVGDYKTFRIYDPKERTVCAAAFPERVLHHALMNVCDPVFERQLISTTCANRTGKGVYYALAYARKYMKKYRYAAKLDIRKYFDSIDQQQLTALLARIFKDARLLKIFSQITGSYHTAEGKGVPIGNLTSQYFANYYLSGLDHYIKEVLHVKGFVRYMDDMLLLCDNRKELENAVKETANYLDKKLHLKLKTATIHPTSDCINFLGYSLNRRKTVLSSRSKKRFEKKYGEIERQLCRGSISEQEGQARAVPLFAFVQHAYTKRYRQRITTGTATGQKRGLTA